MITVAGVVTDVDWGPREIRAEVPDWLANEPALALALYLFGYKEAVDYIRDARVVNEPLNTPEEDDEAPDREPTPEQERAWDLREDDARGYALGAYLDDVHSRWHA